MNKFFLVQIEGSSIREVIEENIGKDFDFVAFADKVKQHNIKVQRSSTPCRVYFKSLFSLLCVHKDLMVSPLVNRHIGERQLSSLNTIKCSLDPTT